MRDTETKKDGKTATPLEEFLTVSRYAGMREDLVQAGGGNSSVKLDERRMLIKASGVQLADITAENGWCVVDYALIRQFMAAARGGAPCAGKEALARALLEGTRPSIETFLHAITGRVTLHTHPVSVNVLASRNGGMEELGKLFPRAILVGYATPGEKLAKLYYGAYSTARERYERETSVVFLKKHGLIVSGETAEEVVRVTEEVNETVEQAVGLDHSPYRRATEIWRFFAQSGFDDGKIVVKAESQYVLDAFAAFGFGLWEARICPDSVVFCGKAAFDFSMPDWEESLKAHVESFGLPALVSYGKDLFIRAESVRKAREIESVLALTARVAMANRGRGTDALSEDEQNFLLDWDAEKYRRKMN